MLGPLKIELAPKVICDMSACLNATCALCVDYSTSVSIFWFILINDLDCSWSEIVNVAGGGLVFPLVQGYLN